jgi:hypothetical protein
MNYAGNAGNIILNSSVIYLLVSSLCSTMLTEIIWREMSLGAGYVAHIEEISIAVKRFTGKLFEGDYFKILSEIYSQYTQCSV